MSLHGCRSTLLCVANLCLLLCLTLTQTTYQHNTLTLLQAAAAGHVQAQYNVAVMHLAGKGTQRACKPALANLKALVEKGPEAAALQAAHEAFFRGHHNQVRAAVVGGVLVFVLAWMGLVSFV